MGFNNPDMPWSEIEALLVRAQGQNGRAPGSPSWNAGGDGPAWSRKRQPYQPPDPEATRPLMRPDLPYHPYAELHCHSNFSFLDGVSHPEQLAEEAARLELEALAVTDHDGLYGVVRFAEAAQAVGLPTVFGAELTLTADAQRVRAARRRRCTQAAVASDGERHVPDPHGEHLLVIADGPPGYAALARAISLGHLAGEKGSPQFGLHDLAAAGAGKWWVLTGCRKGSVPRALVRDGPSAASRELGTLVELFGRDRVLVELWDHGDPLDTVRNDALAELADAPRRRLRRHQQRPLRHARRSAAWPPPSPRCAPGAASTSSTRGCRRPPPPTCAAGPSRSGGSAATPAWSTAPPRSAGRRRSTCRSSPPTCRRSRAPAGSARWPTCAALVDQGWRTSGYGTVQAQGVAHAASTSWR